MEVWGMLQIANYLSGAWIVTEAVMDKDASTKKIHHPGTDRNINNPNQDISKGGLHPDHPKITHYCNLNHCCCFLSRNKFGLAYAPKKCQF
jgi:hypothetical protein